MSHRAVREVSGYSPSPSASPPAGTTRPRGDATSTRPTSPDRVDAVLAASGDPGGTQRQRGRHRLAAGALAPAARARRRLVAQGRPRARWSGKFVNGVIYATIGWWRKGDRARWSGDDLARLIRRAGRDAARIQSAGRRDPRAYAPLHAVRRIRQGASEDHPRLRRVPPAARRRNAGRLLVAGDARTRAVRARRGSRPRHRPPRPRRECAALAEWAAHRTAGRAQEAWTAANVGQRPTVNATDRTAGRAQEAWTGTRCGKRRGSPRRRTGGVRRRRGRGPGAARAGSIRSPWRAARAQDARTGTRCGCWLCSARTPARPNGAGS